MCHGNLLCFSSCSCTGTQEISTNKWQPLSMPEKCSPEQCTFLTGKMYNHFLTSFCWPHTTPQSCPTPSLWITAQMGTWDYEDQWQLMTIMWYQIIQITLHRTCIMSYYRMNTYPSSGMFHKEQTTVLE